jgi:hypothetical protein
MKQRHIWLWIPVRRPGSADVFDHQQAAPVYPIYWLVEKLKRSIPVRVEVLEPDNVEPDDHLRQHPAVYLPTTPEQPSEHLVPRTAPRWQSPQAFERA